MKQATRETDVVHHGGESASGEYGYTLQLIDVATGWSERVMLLGRGQQAMSTAFTQVIDRLPFPITELHPDNGTEFFNQQRVALVERESQRCAALALSTVSEE